MTVPTTELLWGDSKNSNKAITIRYAAQSRQGRDPEVAHKPNQDCFGIHAPLNSTAAPLFVGVYDGHGPTGERCSQFVQRQLPALLMENIKTQQCSKRSTSRSTGALTSDQVQFAIEQAYTECNEELHADAEIDDAHSGTTAITILWHANDKDARITVANVGDSRAILGTTPHGGDQLHAIPLSNDQTPRRRDEAARCQRAGARILSFGQINGTTDEDSDSEDPPRVWAKNGKYPGTAFTRSLGDAVAERLGVSAQPEMLSLTLSEAERYIVLASDGIFDVMSNQQVIDMCAAHDDDPAAACRAIIEHSHAEWLKNEDCDEEHASYDDMTVVCIFLEATPSTSAADGNESSQLPQQTPQQQEEQQQHPHRKRVRQKTLKNLDDMFGEEP